MAQIADITNVLAQELAALEGVNQQHPETGAGIGSGASYLELYTTRIFGSPFQLIDSVDKRFPSVNKHVGAEYLRNFTLNSPILHIKPGMPKYTGSTDSSGIVDSIREIYLGTNSGNTSFAEALLLELASNTIFSKGSKLQKRMFGFRETYWQYMSHVNYMCRSMATFLNLTSDKNKWPSGIMANGSNHFQPFATMKWQNYRMLLSSSVADTPLSELKKLGSATVIGATGTTIGSVISELTGATAKSATDVAKEMVTTFTGSGDVKDLFNNILGNTAANYAEAGEAIAETTEEAFEEAKNISMVDVMSDKISSVLFMVQPVQFEESLSNETASSMIESAVDTVSSSIGQELAFITNSNVDFGMIEGLTEFLGNTVETAANFLNDMVEGVTGGFTHSLVSGAIQGIKGQKMIYPKIYKSSNSSMDYTFTVDLQTPYGDVYNYYVNIIVPLMHLICLAAPRMVSGNSITSPYLVQAFIPGMCTCQLGIISNMQITKNKSTRRVSVNGYPLEVQVTFTIQELYNSLSISPANDPASFLFNETLNDYMANLAGLQPSVDTYTKQRKTMFAGLEEFFTSGEFVQDLAQDVLYNIEDTINPFIRNGS